MRELKTNQPLKVHELTFKVYLLQNIPREEALTRITQLINTCLCEDSRFLEFHQSNKYKYYVFNALYPLERTGIYKEGHIYAFQLRTLQADFYEYIKIHLVNAHTTSMKVLTQEQRLIPHRHIDRIYTLTPAVLKSSAYWRGHMSIEDYERRIRENLIKKYNAYYDTQLDEDFELFHRIQFDNQKPIGMPVKTVRLLGDKLTLFIAENPSAQRLTYMALGAGLLELNAWGMGYCNYHYL